MSYLSDRIESIFKNPEIMESLCDTERQIEAAERDNIIRFLLDLAKPGNDPSELRTYYLREAAARLAESRVGQQTPSEAPWTNAQIDMMLKRWREIRL